MAIKCLKCQSEILDDSRFCSKCGTPIHATKEELEAFTRTLATPSAGISLCSLLGGKYRVLEEVGHGGMGVVYKAEDMKLKRMVAIKFLPRELSLNPEARERFLQEARAAAALAHPNICTIHEVDDSKDKPFIVMEYVEGENLRERIKKGPLSIEEALDITIQAAGGLEKAHQKGIIHRDVKSANIMVTENDQTKIMDFGLAKLRGGTAFTKEGATLGTVAYMSPEQARGDKVDARTDIWSLGVVLYEMLTGELPFKGEREVSILYSIVHEEPKPLKDKKPPIPAELQRVIGRAIAKNLDSRYQTAAEMLRDLRDYRDALRMESAGPLNLRSILKQIKRPLVFVPSLIIIVAAALVIAWFLKRQAEVASVRTQLFPKIESLIEAGRDNYVQAYQLAVKAEKYLPRDPKLAEFFSKIAVTVSIKTEPPGAKIFSKGYKFGDSEWDYLGVSPIEKVRLPVGFFRWMMEKEGYATVYAASSTFDLDLSNPKAVIPFHMTRVLDKQAAIPPRMVRVKGEKVEGIGEIGDFFIDQYEVTNKQFKEFVDKGGYQKKEYWKQKFIGVEKELTWEEAIKTFVDQSGRPGPITWVAGDYLSGQDDYPVSGISWYEAAAYAEFMGKSLPTVTHWDMASAGGSPSILLTRGFYTLFVPSSNFMGKGPVPVGSCPAITSYGVYDMAGNVREWCWNEVSKGRIIRGGAWNDVPYMFSSWSQAPPLDRSPKNGFRCVLYIEPNKITKSAFDAVNIGETVDLHQVKPVPDSVFQIYKEQFSYDKTNLNARVEWKNDSSKDWVHETVTFNAAYDNERMIAHLFLPKKGSPPYQAVIFFPGSGAISQVSSKDLDRYWEFEDRLSLIVKNGRAVVFPIYKGTFERRDDAYASADDNSHLRTDWSIKIVKDFKRSIDYLETRPDIDSHKLAYFGWSWGGIWGAIIPAVEDRLKASILAVGGLRGFGRPEVNDINYVGRVKIPTLMLNGRYDMSLPYEASSKPLYDLLGTPIEDKLQKIYETDHYIPLNEFIKETLAWLDKYLGPVDK
jgi:serine/threonine protein kinase/dienelactone hydrolase